MVNFLTGCGWGEGLLKFEEAITGVGGGKLVLYR